MKRTASGDRRSAPSASPFASETLLRPDPRPATPHRLQALLASPSPYVVAMGGLSLQAVWESLRDTGEFDCDRVVCEAPDGPPLVPARDLPRYDLIGFSLPYELEWVNLPVMLRAGGVPVWAEDRDDDDPLVIAGGASVVMNPEPLAEIVDAFVIGEVEPAVAGLTRVLRECASSRDRQACLEALSRLPGLYVPSHPAPTPIRRLVWDGVETTPRCSLVLSPHAAFPDRFLIETGRGCPHGCRFCLARQVYQPVRYARPEAVLAAAEIALTATRKIGLIGASLSGHPELESVLRQLVDLGAEVSLSSLRADRITPGVLESLRRGGQQSVTIAPEAGTERLRRAVGKLITDEELSAAIAAAEAEGLREVKLYFMTSLPSETPEDAQAIAGLVEGWVRGFPRLRFEVALSPFVPKPWTPFETEPYPGSGAARARLEEVATELGRRTRVTARLGSPRWSAVQAALARADRSAGRALVAAAEGGGGFAAVKKALKAEGLDLSRPLLAPPEPPWRRALGLEAACGGGHVTSG